MTFPVSTLDELIKQGVIQLSRGKIISKKDLASTPGTYPVYSSAQDNDGKFGQYGNYMFDEELITWSVDGGGKFFHRPKHKFSVTNVGGILRIVDANVLDYRFLYYVLTLRHSRIEFDWVRKAHPSVIRELYRDIPLPPLAEQRRIVDLLSRAEGIVRLRREAEKRAAELIPALFLDMFGDPATNPKGWKTVPMKELVSFVSGGTPSKERDDYWTGDLPWVSPKDMKRIGINDALDHINRKVITETSLKLIPIGSVLIVVRGMILIHSVPIAISLVPLTINQDMKALIPSQAVHGAYLLWMLRVSEPQLLQTVATAAHGTKKLETSDLERLLVPVPPLDIQQAFATRMREVESIQVQQSAATAKAQETFDALLGQVFSPAAAT